MYDLLDSIDSSSSSSASDSEDELDVLLLELATTPSREFGPHVNLDGISEIDCKLLFRYNNRERELCLKCSFPAIVPITLTFSFC